MALVEESQNVKAFVTPMVRYKSKRLPMGLASAPVAFQKIMELTMAVLSYEVALVYRDDIIIFGRSFGEHPNHPDPILEDAELEIKGSEFKICSKEIHFLVHIVSKKVVEVDPKKIVAVRKRSPRRIKEFRAKLGLVGF